MYQPSQATQPDTAPCAPTAMTHRPDKPSFEPKSELALALTATPRVQTATNQADRLHVFEKEPKPILHGRVNEATMATDSIGEVSRVVHRADLPSKN